MKRKMIKNDLFVHKDTQSQHTMINGSTSTSKGYQPRYCGVDLRMISNKQNLREYNATGGKGIESCLSEENDLDYDYMLKTIPSTTTTFSMDSSDSSDIMSVESLHTAQSTDNDNISTDDFEDGSVSASASADMQSTIQKKDADFDCSIKRIVSTSTNFSMDSSDSSENTSVDSLSIIENMDADTDSISTTDFEGTADIKDYVEYEQCKVSVSELACKRLYFMGVERSKRHFLLRERLSESIDKGHYTTSNLVDNTSSLRKNGLEAMSSVKSTSNTKSSASYVKKARYPKTKVNKVNEDPDKGMGQGKCSTSEIVGYRLYLEGIERKKRLALLRKEYHKPKLSLETAFERKRIDTNGSECGSDGVDHFQQLYALSKPLREGGRKRRKDIEEASTKRNEVWIHPSEKISIADSTRLYYTGMSELVVLERRRIEASESGEYIPAFLIFHPRATRVL